MHDGSFLRFRGGLVLHTSDVSKNCSSYGYVPKTTTPGSFGEPGVFEVLSKNYEVCICKQSRLAKSVAMVIKPSWYAWQGTTGL